MKTLQECKNEVAVDMGYDCFMAVLTAFDQAKITYEELNIYINRTAELYAKEYAREACGRQIESCATNYNSYAMSAGFNPAMADAAILNTPNAADENYKADKWVSIEESLPETKKYVLCQAEKGLVFTAFYTKGHEVPYEDFDDEGEYDEIEEQKGTLFLKKGWYEECEQKHDEPCYFQRNPTHWQPLPQAPTN